MMIMNNILVNENNINKRLDKFLSETLESLSRSKIQTYIDEGYILVNGVKKNASYKLSLNDEISFKEFPKETSDLVSEKMDIDIIYEDEYLLVINKPVGLVVHPGAGNTHGTLANGLKAYSDNLSTNNGDFRPGIVHRIDKDTSGLLVVAKTNEAHEFLSSQLVDHTLGRKYMALVMGNFTEDEGKIIAPIGRDKNDRKKMAVDLIHGKDAVTYFKVIKRYKECTLIECSLETGRTHQIRVHLNYINHPLVGDNLYGKGNKRIYDKGQLLTAYKISFIHPKDKKRREYEVPLPKFFLDVLATLR